MSQKLETETIPSHLTYINTNHPEHLHRFCDTLLDYFTKMLPHHNHELVIVCIGTDRATGDSLGPLIGYKLMHLHLSNVNIYGTLENPVHAKNLYDTMKHIYTYHPQALIISIDACLGHMDHIGYITIGKGGLKPGIGVKKDLPTVGNLHIMGIVNFSSHMNMTILQNTRLYTVMKMADAIAVGLQICISQYNTWLRQQTREELSKQQVSFYSSSL